MFFRPEAMKKLTAPEELNEAIRVTSPMTWLLVAVLLFGIAAVLAWATFGTVYTRVLGQAFILYEDAEVTEVVAQGGGTLMRLEVQQGDRIDAGAVLAEVANPSLAGRLEQAERIAGEAEEIIVENEETKAAELSEFDRLQGLRRAAMESRLDQAKKMVAAYEARLAGTEGLREQGFTIQATVDDLRTQYFSAQQEVETVKNDIAQLALDREERNTQWDHRILDLKTRHSELMAQVYELAHDLEQTETIRSPVAGEVSPLLVAQGTHLNAGDTVFTIVKPNANLDTLAFLSAADAKLVEPGMKVQISPVTVRKEEFGTILGEVTEVSRFPMSGEALFAVLHNRDLVEQFLLGGPPLLVRIAMLRDAGGGLVWSSNKPPPFEVTAGTLAEVSVITREQAPITLLLPTLKSWAGIQ